MQKYEEFWSILIPFYVKDMKIVFVLLWIFKIALNIKETIVKLFKFNVE